MPDRRQRAIAPGRTPWEDGGADAIPGYGVVPPGAPAG